MTHMQFLTCRANLPAPQQHTPHRHNSGDTHATQQRNFFFFLLHTCADEERAAVLHGLVQLCAEDVCCAAAALRHSRTTLQGPVRR